LGGFPRVFPRVFPRHGDAEARRQRRDQVETGVKFPG
jgi:hypothetical protein